MNPPVVETGNVESGFNTQTILRPVFTEAQVSRLQLQIRQFKALCKKYNDNALPVNNNNQTNCTPLQVPPFPISTSAATSAPPIETTKEIINKPTPKQPTETTVIRPPESTNPTQPALSWQCFSSLLFSGPSRPPEGMISVLSSDVGPFSKAAHLPLVLTSPYIAALREHNLSLNKENNKLWILQRQIRAMLIEKYIANEPLIHPLVGNITGLVSRKNNFRLKKQAKRDVRNIEKEQKKKLQEREDARRKLHIVFLKNVMAHREEFCRFHRYKRSEASRTARNVKQYIETIETRKEKDENKAETRRLQALKENDMEAYSKLVQETKNVRLQYLLSAIHKLVNDSKVEVDDDDDSEEKVSKKYFDDTHRRAEKVIQPHLLKGGDLKEYQLAGLQWLVSLYNNNLNGILADDMGLGKTIQTIALLAYLMEFKHNNGPYLIVVPLSTLSNWVNEFSKWAPEIIKVIYKGTPLIRKQIYKDEVENGLFNVLLTTYEYIMKDRSLLRKRQWQYIIVDEGHRMKNAQSKFAQILGTSYQSRHRILLTGTPLQNNLPELWALLNFLLPTIFSSVDTFDQWFNKPFASFKNSSTGPTSAANAAIDNETDEMTNLNQEERLLIVHRLHEVLRPFMLRRIKSQVLDQLPDKVEKVLRCELSGWQRRLYRIIHRRCTTNKEGELVGGGLNNVIMQLRKICNHPYLFLSDWLIDDDLIRCSGKFEILDRMLPKLKAGGHRILIFSQMTQVMTILERFFDLKGFSYLRLDGGTISDDREKRMFMFNDPDSPYFIFLLSTRAGGLGLNLATADTVILFDSDWNPMMDAQAQDRAHRIGQKNEVRVFRLITTSAMEEKILSRATDKRNLTGLVVDAGKFHKDNGNTDDRKEMMAALLKEYGESIEVDDEADHEVEVPDDEQINEMMAITDVEFELYQNMDRERESKRLQHWISYHKSQGITSIDNIPKLPKRLMTPDDIPLWIKDPGVWHSRHVQLLTMSQRPDIDNENAFDTNTGNDGNDDNNDGYDSGTSSKIDGMKECLIENLIDLLSYKDVPTSTSTSKKSPHGTTNATSLDVEVCNILIRVIQDIQKIKTNEGYMLTELFNEKPDKKLYPDYYQIIHEYIRKEIYSRAQVLLQKHFGTGTEYTLPAKPPPVQVNSISDNMDYKISKTKNIVTSSSTSSLNISNNREEGEEYEDNNDDNDNFNFSGLDDDVDSLETLAIPLSTLAARSGRSSTSISVENAISNVPKPIPKKRGRKRKHPLPTTPINGLSQKCVYNQITIYTTKRQHKQLTTISPTSKTSAQSSITPHSSISDKMGNLSVKILTHTFSVTRTAITSTSYNSQNSSTKHS
eukprot:gene1914-3715_t